MKILHITAYAHRGGCEKNCYHFINQSAEHSHDIIVLGDKGPMTNDWEALGVSVLHLNIVSQNIIRFASNLKQVLQTSGSFDYVICWSSLRLPLQLFAINGICPKVRVYLGNPRTHNTAKDYILSKIFNSKLNVRLMACSDHVAKSFRDSFFYKNWNIQTSLNPVELPEVLPDKHIDPKVFNIGMVARLDPIKDHATVLKAFAIFSTLHPDSVLHFVGDGILRYQLQLLSDKLSLNARVVFHGDVKDVYNHLNHWDLFVYSTTADEGLGSVVGEAMANGVPCLLCDLPMMRELAPIDGLVEWFEAGNQNDLSKKLNKSFENKADFMKKSNQVFQHAQHSFSTKRFINDFINE